MTVKSRSDRQLARVAANLAISVVGLVIVRFLVRALPMFHDAGSIVADKLTVLAAIVIAVDALLLSVLVRFAIEIRAYLLGRFAEIPGFGNMAASLVSLLASGIAYTDFKPLTRAWPSIKDFYLWGFFALAASLVAYIVFSIFQNRDSMAALVLKQPLPARSSSEHSNASETTVLVGR